LWPAAAAIVDREPLLQERIGLLQALDGCRPTPLPSTSAAAALATISAGTPVLLTTADHALLRPEMVEHFWPRSPDRRLRCGGAALASLYSDRRPNTRGCGGREPVSVTGLLRV